MIVAVRAGTCDLAASLGSLLATVNSRRKSGWHAVWIEGTGVKFVGHHLSVQHFKFFN
jgi:hypothetical protein